MKKWKHKDVKYVNNNAKNSTTFSNCIRNVPIEYEKIMLSFDVTFFYWNIPIIDKFNITKGYVNNDNQFTRKMGIPHGKIFDLALVSSLFNGAYSIITSKNDWTRENATIKQVLKENGYQESIISKIFKRITNNHRLSQSQQQI